MDLESKASQEEFKCIFKQINSIPEAISGEWMNVEEDLDSFFDPAITLMPNPSSL